MSIPARIAYGAVSLAVAAVFLTGSYVPFLLASFRTISVAFQLLFVGLTTLLVLRYRHWDRLFVALLVIPLSFALLAALNGTLLWGWWKLLGWCLLPAAYWLSRYIDLRELPAAVGLWLLAGIALIYAAPEAARHLLYGDHRAAPLFVTGWDNPNVFAFLILLPAGFYLSLFSRPTLQAAVAVSGLLLMLLTGSAIGTLLYVTVAGFVAVRERVRISWPRVMIAGSIGLTVAIGLVYLDAVYFQSFTTTGSMVVRLEIYQTAWAAILERPLLGVGAGAFPVLWFTHLDTALLQQSYSMPDATGYCISCGVLDCWCHPMAHNLPLTLTAELGVLALLPLAVAAGVAVTQIRDTYYLPFVLAPLAWSLFDEPLFFWPNLAIFGLLLGRMCASEPIRDRS